MSDAAHEHDVKAGASIVGFLRIAANGVVALDDQPGWIAERFADMAPLIAG